MSAAEGVQVLSTPEEGTCGGEARTQGKEHGIWDTYWVVMAGLDLANWELRRRLGTVDLRL
jgi:hypothetical protein